LKWIKAHAGVDGNEAADKKAKEGQEKADNSDIVDLTIPCEIRVSGAKLNTLTQSMAYKAIRALKSCSPDYLEALARPATEVNLERARETASSTSGKCPTNARIWTSLRHKDFSKKIRYFLWLVMHNGYKIGKYWWNIPGYEERGTCSFCNTEESMEHILTQCSIIGQQEIWNLTGSLWQDKGLVWTTPNMGDILACGIVRLQNEDGKFLKGESRLRRILISETAYLIWKIRNDRVINGKHMSLPEIQNRWMSAINARLVIDCLSANPVFKSKGLKKSLVKQTWKDVCSHKINLPKEWTRETGVLVSMRAGVG
jgi:ribonuclease HI